MTTNMIIDSSYEKKEELWNSITHGLGVVLAIPGLVFLILKANEEQSTIALVSYIVFGVSLILMFLSSTLYHAIPKYKTALKKLDHSAIFVLIAGTYTPIMLVAFGGALGWVYFGIEWALALIGIVLKQFFVHRFKMVSLLVYIGMGWLVIFVAKPLIGMIGMNGFGWLLAGGLFYTVGTYFYKNDRIKYNHAIWHLFVLAGCVSMYACVYLYL